MRLPSIVDDLARRWSLQPLGRPIQPRGAVVVGAPVRDRAGKEPRRSLTDDTGALLLERCARVPDAIDPGRTPETSSRRNASLGWSSTPKPYVGDPTYDALQHMLTCEQRLLTDPTGLAARMAQLLRLDVERLTLWLFARCVQECPDSPSLRQVAARLAPR